VPQENFAPPPPPRPYSTSEALRKFEARSEDAYRLGEGDNITIQIWDHLELSGPQVVGPDGQITLPVAGSLRIAGLTREDAAKVIKEALSKSFDGIVVTVKVDQYISNRVILLGKVKTPGVYRFETQPTLLEAISRAGGLMEDTRNVFGITNWSHCAVLRGRDRVAWLDLRVLMEGGDLNLNLRLAPNDVVLVPEQGDLPVYVLGQVVRPGPLRWIPGMSVLDAIAQGGGMTRDADPNKILVVRPSRNERINVYQSDLLAPTPGANVAVERGDIVYVPSSILADIGYFFEKLNPWGWVFLAQAVK
jgi:polysaccharide export outer membrane protein